MPRSRPLKPCRGTSDASRCSTTELREPEAHGRIRTCDHPIRSRSSPRLRHRQIKPIPSGNSDRRVSHALFACDLVLRGDAPAATRVRTWQSFPLCTSYVKEVAPAFTTDGNFKTFVAQLNFGQGTSGNGVCGFEPRLSCESFTRRSIRSLHHWPSARVRTGMIVCRVK
jgi:hypothetical protein